MKKILFSLMTMVLVVGMVGGGAFAQFFDTETSEGNTFTAGTLNLVPGSEFPAGTYTGAVANYQVTAGGDGINGKVEFGTDEGIKPGDSGSIIWSLKNDGSIAGTLSIVASYTSLDVDQNEPEIAAGDNAAAEGELDDQMLFDLSGGGLALSGVKIADVVTALTAETEALAANGGTVVAYTLAWTLPDLPGTTNNLVQSDSLGLDVTFNLVQD